MLFSHDVYFDIKTIQLAHEFVLDRVQKCEYPQGRGHYGLVFVQSGRAEYRFFTGDRFTIGEGDVLFLSPKCAYSIVTEKAFKHYTVNFDIHEDSSKTDMLSRSYYLLQGESVASMEQIFKELITVWGMKKPGFEMRSVGYLYELLSQFYFAYAQEQISVSYHRLLPAKEYIEQHFENTITLEQLAFLSNMSVTNFRREWKKHYAESPIRYRDRIRLYYAREYLSSGYYTVTEIAKKCGFEDTSYFVRFFKQKTGHTPNEFKRQFLGK